MSYDSWLLAQADYYMSPCEPEVDRDGEYTKCINCDERFECESWLELEGYTLADGFCDVCGARLVIDDGVSICPRCGGEE